MSDIIRVPAGFYSRRVYYCLYLMDLVDRIYHGNFCLYAKILKAVVRFEPSLIHLVSSIRVENYEQSCLLSCEDHLVQVLQNEARYNCMSERGEDDLIVEKLEKIFCNGCVRHNQKKVYHRFSYENFLLTIFDYFWRLYIEYFNNGCLDLFVL